MNEKKSEKESFQERLFVARVKYALTYMSVQQLSVVCTVSQSTIGHWAEGKNLPHRFIVPKLIQLIESVPLPEKLEYTLS